MGFCVSFYRLIAFVCSNGGEVPEWLKGTDCKSVGEAFGGSNPPLPTTLANGRRAGVAQLARASAFQAEGRGFESRFPLHLSCSWFVQFLVTNARVPT